jgi:hypothetical protein
MISRRRFTAGVAIALTPLGARASAQEYKAQQLPSIPRIGVLTLSVPFSTPTFQAFRQGLRDQGYEEARNITLELRFANGSADRLGEHGHRTGSDEGRCDCH